LPFEFCLHAVEALARKEIAFSVDSEDSMPCSQEHTIGPYPEPDESSTPHPSSTPILFFSSPLTLSSDLCVFVSSRYNEKQIIIESNERKSDNL
jgi:hypothetical protein